jgi:hypothetical protein
MNHRIDVRGHKATEIGVSFTNYYFKFSDEYCYKISFQKNKQFSIGDLEDHEADKLGSHEMGKLKIHEFLTFYKGFRTIP